jgi:uncharacterized UPF0160 family protein
MYLITHSSRAHFDDLLSISLLLVKYPGSDVIRVNDISKLSKDIMDNAIVVDVSEIYDKVKFFDHHQDIKLNSSFVLVLKHFFNIDLTKLYPIFRNYEFYDLKDRYGPEKAINLMNITCNDISFYLSPIEDFLLVEFSKREIIKQDDWLYNVLVKLGEYFLASIDRQFKDIEDFNKTVKVERINKYNVAISLDKGFGLTYYRKLLSNIDIVVQQNERNKEHLSLISLDTNKVNFLKLKDKEHIFIHPNGFLMVIEKSKDYKDYINAL